MEYGKEVRSSDFIPIAWWIANAWDPCEEVRLRALTCLCSKHLENVRNLQQQGQFDESAEIELWNPCMTYPYPPGEDAMVKQLKQEAYPNGKDATDAMVSDRARRDLQVRDANLIEWRIWKGFGKGPWKSSRKASPEDLATQSRWVQLDWPIQRSDGVLCPKNCLCSICMANYGLTDMRVAILRRRSNSRTTSEELKAIMSALKDFRSYCADISNNAKRRLNMDIGVRLEIENRLRTERDWIRKDRVLLFAEKHEIEERKKELASFIEHIGSPPAHEVDLDELDAEHRSRLQHCFKYDELVSVTDASTGKVVVGRIEHAIRSTRLGAGDEPDWVLIKGVWYRDKEVGVERTKEIDDYQSSDSEFASESGSLVDLKDHFVADVEIGHNELPSY